MNQALLQPNPDLYLESDVDDQLLIAFGFLQPIRAYALKIRCNAEAVNGGFQPLRVKVVSNTPNLDFQSAEDIVATQELQLSTEQLLTGEILPLRFVKFQNVTHLTLFFGETCFPA